MSTSQAQNILTPPSPDHEAYQARLQRGLERYPDRKANFERCQNSARGEVLNHLPTKMDYEVVSRCNFRCLMCRISEWPGGKRAEDMPFDGFKQSLDQQYGLVEIKLQGVGEPLLHERICDMVALAGERDIWTRLTVNASLLHVNDNYKRLIDADPGEVQVSIDGATKEVFERIRRGAWFEKVVDNTRRLNEYCLSQNLLKTRSWTVVQKDNVHQLEDIVRLGARMKFERMTFSVAISNWGLDRWTERNREFDVSAHSDRERILGLMELGRELGVEVTFWDAGHKFKLNGPRKELCGWLFERAFISSDMRIVPCCVLSSPDVKDFGPALDLGEIWNQPVYRRLRQDHISGNIPGWCRQCYGL